MKTELEHSPPESINGEADEPSPKPPKSKKPKRAKKPIKSTVNVHDRTQIETVVDYYLNRGPKLAGAVGSRDTIRYRVDAFLFYPRQFGIDPTTYPKERFYNDIRPLIRFREPRLSHKQMLGLKERIKSPLIYLSDYLVALESGRMLEPLPRAIDEVRIFACSFISNYLKNIDRKRRRFTSLMENPEAVTREELLELFQRTMRIFERAHELILVYRALFDVAARIPEGTAEELKVELRLIDEYCYYRLRDGVAYLLLLSEDFRKSELLNEGDPFLARAVELLDQHDQYAQRAGYFVIRPDSPVSVRERFLHRRGELKRRIWAVLFLDIRTEPLFAFQRQTGAMIAAGMAALWAVGAQYMLVRKAVANDSQIDFLGLSGLLFLAAGVFAYVIKDRIKEIGRSYFRSGLFRRIPDHSERIYYRPDSNDEHPIGRIREIAKFETLDSLPPKIKAIRDSLARGTEVEEQTVDNVLRYTKVITLSRKIRILGRYSLRAVHDILRLNIDACLPRLGEPVRYLDVVDAQGVVHQMTFPKVYYLDLALTCSRLGEDTDQIDEQSVDYFRLVVDKTGLLRVERLS